MKSYIVITASLCAAMASPASAAIFTYDTDFNEVPGTETLTINTDTNTAILSAANGTSLVMKGDGIANFKGGEFPNGEGFAITSVTGQVIGENGVKFTADLENSFGTPRLTFGRFGMNIYSSWISEKGEKKPFSTLGSAYYGYTPPSTTGGTNGGTAGTTTGGTTGGANSGSVPAAPVGLIFTIGAAWMLRKRHIAKQSASIS